MKKAEVKHIKTAEIKYIRFMNLFGRTIPVGQLHDPYGKILLGDGIDGASIAQMLEYCDTHEIHITNAQEILNLLVRTGGFGA
jgi:hypothetical protein